MSLKLNKINYIKDFLGLKYSLFLLILTLIVVALEFLSYSLAYPIISIFLDLDSTFIDRFNNLISSKLNIDLQIKKTVLLTLLIIILLFQSIFFSLFRYVTVKTTLHYLRYIRSKIFNNFFDSTYNPDIKSSYVLNALTIQSMNVFYFWNAFIEIIKKSLIIIALLALFIILNYQVLIISFLILSLFFIIINKLSFLSKIYGKKLTYLDEDILNLSTQSFKNYRYIKITNLKNKIFKSLDKINQNFNSNHLKFTMLNKLIKESSEPIAIMLIIIIGYFSHIYFNIEIPLLIICILLLRRILNNTTAAFTNYQSLLKFNESVVYIQKLLKSFIVDKQNKKKNILSFKTISFEGVDFFYNKKKFIFKNLNFIINKNEPLLVFGSSGVGKSTLINLILGLLKPIKGKIKLNNKNTNIYNISNNLKIGLVSQDEVIFNMSLYDNLLLRNPKAKKSIIIKYIKLLGLDTIFKNKKIDLSMKINENSSNLSGGEKQRIALLRELLLEPELLILDEPTSALDDISIKKIIKLLNKIKLNTTLIIFTHQKEFLKLNFKVLNLKNKTIVTK